MKKEVYFLVSNETNEEFTFKSTGPKGIIKKVIRYERITKKVFNLAFGDLDEKNGTINDKARTNNGDRDKVVATVALSVMKFMENHPDAIVYAKGENPAKTRLYQMGINSHWSEISSLFQVEGFRNGYWMPFAPG